MSRIYIGIDNGPTGSVGVIRVSKTGRRTWFCKVPTFKEQNYTKKKQQLTRINIEALTAFLSQFPKAEVALERPLVNPKLFRATISAVRTLEAELCVLEYLKLGYIYIDSKKWQSMLLPEGTKGTADLKRASQQIGTRMFPKHSELIAKHGDADGILIAEFLRRVSR